MLNLIRKLSLLTVVVTILCLVPGAAFSQNQNQLPADLPDLIIEAGTSGVQFMDDLKAIRAAAENSPDLAEDVKKNVLSLVDQAILLHESKANLRKDLEALQRTVQSAPEQTKILEGELDQLQPASDGVATTASNMNSDQRENYLRKVEAEFQDATANLNKLNDQLNALKNRPAELQQKILADKQRLSVIAEELEAAPSPDVTALLVRARQAALIAEQAKTKTEIELFQNQLANQDAIMALLTAERDLASRTVAVQETLVKSWQGEVQRLRELEAQKERVVAEQAKELAADMPPIIQKQYDISIAQGKLLEKVTAEEADIQTQLERRQAQLKQLEADYAIALEQIKYPMHTTETIGLALREQRRTLPSIENFRRQSNQRRMQMSEMRVVMMDLDRQRNELSDLDNAVAQILQSEPDLAGADLDLLKTELRRLLGDRREIIKKLQAGYQRLFKKLQNLEFIEQQIADKAQEEARFLDEHLLWIRSAKVIGIEDLKNLPAALKWLFSPYNWWQASQILMRSLPSYPVSWALIILIPTVFICLRHWAHRNLSRVARQVYSIKTDSFSLTLRALALTVRVSFGWPLLIGLVGWQMGRLSATEDFAFAAGSGLMFAAQTLAGSQLLNEMCWKEGVAKVHFKWPESVRRAIRRDLRWFIPLLAVSSFILTTVQTQNDAVYTDSLGRLALIVLMLGFFLWSAYELRFSGEIVSMLIHRRQDGWLVRLRFIWYPLAMGAPLFLILLAALGYFYSAGALFLRLGETIALILGLIVVKDLVLRSLFIIQRRLVYEDIQRKKEAEIQKQEREGSPGPIERETLVIEEPEIDLNQLHEKNQVLLRTIIFFSALVGLWLIWANVLPALNILENIKLWSYSSEVEGVRTSVPITLADVMGAIIVAIVTIVAAKNLPGLLQIVLLNRFAMDYGARYAYTTIFSYGITAVGVAAAFTTIGIRWSNIQWLIAALGVGLGFGLQEVVANFICGLIVLFERPFRIGDTVTVADISGTVTRIQIRATTIVDWDRKELIVPNKEFVTGRLINWSLSDNIIRIKIPIGIAYGSDTELAEKLLLEAAAENPMVLQNPEAHAIFLGFGDNSLNFELRVFINGINDWIPMLHKLNQTVDRKFREYGVTISFPQRDVHLDQTGPLEVRVVSDG
jgi:potassium efflux system protein